MSKSDSFSWLGFPLGILCLAGSPKTHAQDASPRVEWEKTFGGRENDGANSVEQTADGGYIVAGYTGPAPFGRDGDWLLIKLDAEGELDPRWPENPRIFDGGRGSGQARSVQQTKDGGYIVAGEVNHVGGAGSADVSLIKLDAEGELDPRWPENPWIFDGGGYDIAYSVEQTADGGYIVAGHTKSFGAGGGDVYLSKHNAEGELDPRWGTQSPENPRTFGGPGIDIAFSVEQTADGGYIVAGTQLFSAVSCNFYLIKLDAEGDLDPRWPVNPRTTFGRRECVIARSVEQTADGGYIVAGNTEPSVVGRDVYLMKLDAEGELDPRWPVNPRTFGGREQDVARSVKQTADGGYIVAGYTQSSDFDGLLIKLGAEGGFDPRWSDNPRIFGGRRDDIANSVEQTADGGYIVAGFTWSFGAGSSDVYLIKLAPDPSTPARFLRGDCNGDGTVDISDAVCTLEWLFLGRPEPGCVAATNTNGDKAVDISDPVSLLGFLFLGGPPPVDPFPDCGRSDLETDQELGCVTPKGCQQ